MALNCVRFPIKKSPPAIPRKIQCLKDTFLNVSIFTVKALKQSQTTASDIILTASGTLFRDALFTQTTPKPKSVPLAIDKHTQLFIRVSPAGVPAIVCQRTTIGSSLIILHMCTKVKQQKFPSIDGNFYSKEALLLHCFDNGHRFERQRHFLVFWIKMTDFERVGLSKFKRGFELVFGAKF